MSWWRFDGEHGTLATLDRSGKPPPQQPFSWGRIRIVDRLGVENDWLAFGGTLRVADVDPATRLVQFHAPAPIYRWAGHSQGLDWLTDEVGAFFARLRVPIDFRTGAEQRVGEADPRALYAAFTQDAWRPVRGDDAADRRRAGAGGLGAPRGASPGGDGPGGRRGGSRAARGARAAPWGLSRDTTVPPGLGRVGSLADVVQRGPPDPPWSATAPAWRGR